MSIVRNEFTKKRYWRFECSRTFDPSIRLYADSLDKMSRCTARKVRRPKFFSPYTFLFSVSAKKLPVPFCQFLFSFKGTVLFIGAPRVKDWIGRPTSHSNSNTNFRLRWIARLSSRGEIFYQNMLDLSKHISVPWISKYFNILESTIWGSWG